MADAPVTEAARRGCGPARRHGLETVRQASACIAGSSLLSGRANLGPEPNQPNTINGSCADGTSGGYHSDESVDAVTVSTTDGAAFAPGKTARIDVTVWAYSGFPSDKFDLYYAADASAPNWTHLLQMTHSSSSTVIP